MKVIKVNAMPPIRAPSLQYAVTPRLGGRVVVKTPRPGHAHAVKADWRIFTALGDLAPWTHYHAPRNCLIQEAVVGRFATWEEVAQVARMVEERGYLPVGLLPHDVIMGPNGPKVIDVGNFRRIPRPGG